MALPTNYNIASTDPLASFTDSFKMGSDMRAVGIQQDEQEQQLAQQEQRASLFAKLRSPDATGQDFRNAALASDEKQSKAIMEVFEARTTEQNNASLSRAGRTLYAYKNGNAAMGEKLLNTQITAQRNSGNEEQANYLETMLSISKESPDSFIAMLSSNMAMMPGGTEAIDAVNKIAMENREVGLHTAAINQAGLDAKLKKSQIAVNRANANKSYAVLQKTNEEAGKVAVEAQIKLIELQQARNPEVVLTAPAEKLVNESVVSAVNSKSLANQYETLAKSITAELSSGKVAEAGELIKKIWGSEDEVSRLRQEYKRLRNTQVLQSLPPGVASDKDIEIAMGVFPSETANPDTIASFLNEASVNELKADWVNANGSLGRAKKSGPIGDGIYGKGDSFAEAVGRITTVSPIDPPLNDETPAPVTVVSVDF